MGRAAESVLTLLAVLSLRLIEAATHKGTATTPPPTVASSEPRADRLTDTAATMAMSPLLLLLLLLLVAAAATATKHHVELDDDVREEVEMKERWSRARLYETFRHPALNIIGGETISIKDAPYQVSVEVNKAHFCGGSVLAAKWVLTAAHCVYRVPVGSLGVRAGTDILQHGGSRVAVRAAYVHSKYGSSCQYDHDVAVLELASALSLGAAVKAVKLPASGKEPQNNIPVFVTGWGLTVASKTGDTCPFTPPANPKLSSKLLRAKVFVVNRSTCGSAYGSVLTARMVCAAAPGKDACTYDSGGPLVDQQGVQVGIVSFGHGCANAAYPGVYTHLGNADVRSFIKSHTKL